ncbi:class I tRNA ligase family protein [Streptomyces sp. L7]
MNGATIEGELPARRAAVGHGPLRILSRLNKTVSRVDALYDDFQFAKLSDALYHLPRGTKSSTGTSSCRRPRSWRAASPQKVSGRVLGEVLDVTLKLLHPIVPFVTETLWTTLTGGESIVIAELAEGRWLPRRGGRARDRDPPAGHHRGPPLPRRPGPRSPASASRPASP